MKLETAYWGWIDEGEEEVLKVAPLSLRYTFRREIDTLLHYNGFEISSNLAIGILVRLQRKAEL